MVALRDRLLMTVEEYFEWEETQEERHEYWDGEVVATAGATKNHHRVARNFSNKLNTAFGDGPCEVFTADIRVRVEPRRKYFIPISL